PCDWPGVAHGFRHRFAPAARAPGAGTYRVHRRNTALHGSRTNRANESLNRFAERPLRLRRDAVRDASWWLAIHRFRSDGIGALPYRKTADTSLRAVEEHSGPGFGNNHEVAR